MIKLSAKTYTEYSNFWKVCAQKEKDKTALGTLVHVYKLCLLFRHNLRRLPTEFQSG